LRKKQNEVQKADRGGEIGRRQFLLWNLKIAIAGLLPFPLWGAKNAGAASIPDIVTVGGEPAAATRRAVERLGGIQAFVRPGQKVVIKPNMSFPHGIDHATSTHPFVVRELAAMCREAGAARVLVLDHPLRKSERCIEGMKKACDVFDSNMVHGVTSSDLYQAVTIPEAVSFRKTDVMKAVLDADVLISAPVAKSHSSAGVSLSMKGMMGLIYNRSIMHWRYDLDQAIADLASLLKPDLVVIDASRVLSTNGPSGPGDVIRANQIVASRDMVAADAQVVSMFPWYGQRIRPENVAHIRIAGERGLGRMDIENLSIEQDRVE
jgi:uncharacterized protein (DUF362 family)